MIIRRLQEIAGRSHWLHVLRIAASKILGSTQHEAIRDDLIAMLDSVDAGDRLDDDRILRTGSRIAMQLLVDGTAANIPAFRRKLIVRTLNLLDLPDPKMSRALFSALDFGQKALLEPRLIESLNSENSTVRKAALRVLALASASAKAQSWTWAKELLLGYWPAQNEEALDSWDSTDLLPNDPETLARLHKMQFASPPSAVVKWRRFMVDEFEEMSFPSGVAVMSLPTRGGTIPFLSTTGDKSNIGFNYWKLSSASNVIEVSGDALPIWHVVRAAGLFSQDPSLQSALAFLDEVISLGLARDAEALSLPWLLHALVEDSDGENALLLKRSDLLSGIFGDTSDWLAREAHWELGIDVNAIAVRWIAPPGSPGRLLGLPTLVGLTIRRSKGPNIQKDFLTLLETFPNNTWAVQTFLSYLARLRPTLLPQTILYICQSDLGFLESIPNCLYYLAISLIEAAHMSGNAQLVSKLQAVVRLYPAIAQSISLPLVRLVDLFERFPEARELISIMVAPACRALQRRSETKLALPPAALGHLPGDSHVVTASITALRVLSGTETDRDRDTVERLLSWDGIPLALILDALTRGRLPVSSHAFASIIARAAITRGRKQWTASAYSVLEDLSEAAPVELLEQSKAKALRLPLALPSRSASSE